MENNIIDLFEDASNNINSEAGEKSKSGKKGKSYSLKSSVMMEAMGLMSNPKKLKGIIAALVSLLVIGFGSVIAFFVIYPICIIWAIILYVALITGYKVLKLKKNAISKRDH